MLLFVASAHAFCGAYVGSAGAVLENASTVVVLARGDGRTTLTLAPDVKGNRADFGVVIPVPAGMDAAAVTSGDADAVALLDAYSAPRGVAYTCDDLWSASASGGSGCASPIGEEEHAAAAEELGGKVDAEVTLHASFTAGSYEVSMVSADEGGTLADWLDGQGWAVPDGGQAVLDEYVDAGSWFLTARVTLDAAPSSSTGLAPLRIAYDGESATLPIRIGTMSAADEQEVIVLALDDAELGISNYPELALETECMWKGDDLGAVYEQALEDATAEAGGAGWYREYSWDLSSHCDPCTTEQTVDDAVLSAVGWTGSTMPHLTRLRVRYDPANVTQDLAFYETGRTGVTDQVRFVRYAEELEEWFPVCDEGWADDPGTCPQAVGGGCTTPVAPASGAATLLALALLRRRR